MSKVALIGAGSIVFTKQFLNDMFNTPCMAGSTYALMGPTLWKLEKMKQYADQIIEKNNIDAHIYCTTDRRDALKDADFVILTFQVGGNVSNKPGYITNLPADATVEVPVYADQYGFHPTYIGALPMQLAAMNQSNLTTQGLAAQAAIEADPELVYWAIAMDPLTSTKVTLNECRNMVADLFEAEAKGLPQFEGKTFKRLNDIDVPEGTVGVPVPEDPALAINNRFAKLAE